MEKLTFYTEDKIITWQILDYQKAKDVHIHTIDEYNKYQIIRLPFTVEGNLVSAILPANTKFIGEPHLSIVLCGL